MAALKDLAAKEAIDLPHDLKEKLYRKKWVVYTKRPFAKPENVIEYLGRYTHKTAISNYRLKEVNNHTVKFSYKDYKTGGSIKEMTLAVFEFIRIQKNMGISKPKLTESLGWKQIIIYFWIKIKTYIMNATQIFYDDIAQIRDLFHKYGRFDDANAKLDELSKYLCIYVFQKQNPELAQFKVHDF